MLNGLFIKNISFDSPNISLQAYTNLAFHPFTKSMYDHLQKELRKKNVVPNHPIWGDLAINVKVRGDLANVANSARIIKI